MNFQIESSAEDYIKAKSLERSITLSVVERPGGVWSGGACGQSPRHPSVRLGKPPITDNYEYTEINGIYIYYLPSLSEMFKEVTIKIEKLFFLKWLVVIGKK